MSNDFVRFLNNSPTAYHAAREIQERLKFKELKEADRWQLEPGQSYCILRGDSLIVAFRMPKKKPERAVLLASHIDSPALKLKPHSESSSHGIGLIGTENYGAPLLHTWLDRDLKIAGRVTLKDCQTKLVCLEDLPISIPSLAIHLNRDVTEKGLIVHKQDHLKAPFTLQFHEKALEKKLGGSLLGFDLFLVSAEKPSFLGFEQDLLAAYRLDNLTSAYSSMEALRTAKPSPDTLQIAVFWDHEEIGSTSYVGAGSLFLDQILERIVACSREDLFRMKSQSLCLSIDVAHGFHPNFSDKYDPTNTPELGKGVVVKFNANQKYATDSLNAARLIERAHQKKIAVQKQANRSDLPSGSTVGSIMAANLGISTVDIGISCWAMHSIRECIAIQDLNALTALLEANL